MSTSQIKEKKVDETFTIKVEPRGRHALVTVFNRGGFAGTLTILADDLGEFARRISGSLSIEQSVETIESGANVVGVKIDRLG